MKTRMVASRAGTPTRGSSQRGTRTSLIRPSGLDDAGHLQLGGHQAEAGIDATEQQDGEDDGKVGYQGLDLGREIAAEFELLQGQGHGVRPKEKDEGHECQVWNELAGIPKQLPTVVQTLLLAQQRPVQCCEVKGVVLGDQAQERKGQGLPGESAVSLPLESLRQPTHPSDPPQGPATELCSWRQAVSRNNKLQGPWED